MKIAIVVHGRFHAFDLVRALLKRGHDVTLFTNYPTWAVERFGISRAHVCSFWLHGGSTRALRKICQKLGLPYPEAYDHQTFGAWVARQLRRERWDVIHCFSGIAEEVLRTVRRADTLKTIVRGSSHIRTQARLLAEEAQRTGLSLEQPGSWIIAREEREYQLADLIIVLSRFAYDSFVSEGVPASKVSIMPLGAQIEAFRPPPEIVDARCRRILSGAPLHILYVGALSVQKGMWDMAAILSHFKNDYMHFRFIGASEPGVTSLLQGADAKIEIVPRQPHYELPRWYAEGDMFIFTTVQDGFAVVLSQAQAAALPILTTTNCAGPDMVQDGITGWVLPIRNPAAFIERLRWCDVHRQELAEMVWRVYHDYQPRDWDDVAVDFERICRDAIA